MIKISAGKTYKMSENKIESVESAGKKPAWLDIVHRQVGSLRYGVVQVVVHDSQVTQIDKTERVRLENLRAETI
jgi:hypothetical protein